jgi:hypothetical protein
MAAIRCGEIARLLAVEFAENRIDVAEDGEFADARRHEMKASGGAMTREHELHARELG